MSRVNIVGCQFCRQVKSACRHMFLYPNKGVVTNYGEGGGGTKREGGESDFLPLSAKRIISDILDLGYRILYSQTYLHCIICQTNAPPLGSLISSSSSEGAIVCNSLAQYLVSVYF